MYEFDVLRKGDHYFAVAKGVVMYGFIYSPPNIHIYNDQGYIYWGSVLASNAALAVDYAKEQDQSIIMRLNAQIAEQAAEIQKLSHELKLANNNQGQHTGSPFDVDPLLVLGLEAFPSLEEIKKRHKVLTKAFHSDREGSDFLMSLINAARDKLLGKK